MLAIFVLNDFALDQFMSAVTVLFLGKSYKYTPFDV